MAEETNETQAPGPVGPVGPQQAPPPEETPSQEEAKSSDFQDNEVAQVVYETRKAVDALKTRQVAVNFTDAGPEETSLIINLVRYARKSPKALTAADIRDRINQVYKDRGWKKGSTYSRFKKESPLLVPFKDQSESEKIKDKLTIAVINSFK